MSSHEFNKQAWAKMTVFEQMGNIGSEVGRALSAKHRNKNDWMTSAFYRGIDLMNFTIEIWAAQKSPRFKELLYAREMFTRSILTDEEDKTLDQYFFQFALAARRNR